MKTISQFIKTR